MAKEFKTVLYEVKDKVLTITMNRPDKLNAVSMDIRVFSRTGKYGFVFVKRALSPDAASTWFLPRVVGMSRATELMLTGKMFNGDQAYEYGLANYVEEAEDVYPKALEIAKEIATYAAPISVAMARQMLWKSYMYDHPMASHKLDSMCLYHLTHAVDAQEGSQSFFEKRDPEWEMKPSTDMPYFYPWWEEREFPTQLDLV